MTVRLGQTLHGKWHLDSFIGRGGSADVYAASADWRAALSGDMSASTISSHDMVASSEVDA